MAEVVVDAKPMPKLPYDPDVIPEAVRKRAAAVDALYSSTALTPTNGSGGQAEPSVTPESAPQEPAPAPQEPAQDVPVSSPTPVPSAPAEPSPAPSPPEDENSETWRARANGYHGRYNAAQRQLAEMQEQMAQMGNELLHAQRLLSSRQAGQQPPSQSPASPPVYLTEQDVQNYGSDLVDFTQRAAVQAVTPHLQRLESENAELRQQVARERRYSLDQMVEQAVPNYREIDRNPRWHQWLLGIDPYTGYVRQQLLDDAKATASAPRVISFFKGFLAEEVATGNMEPAQSSLAASAPKEPAVQLATLASPGRARPAAGSDPSLLPNKPTYTRAQIRDLYSAHRKGAYVGREAEWKRIDADIIAAGAEGRVFN